MIGYGRFDEMTGGTRNAFGTIIDTWDEDRKIKRFHNVVPGQPHVHSHFHAASHEGHRVVAICGKGGVGKTAFTALLVRACVKSGDCGRILVVDADPAFGLALALGVKPAHTIGEVREQIIHTAQGGAADAEAELAGQLDYLIFESLVETDNFAFMAMGRSDALGCYCAVNDLLRDAVSQLAGEFDTVVIDGEAGLEQVNRQVMACVDELIILTDGSARGMNTVELLAKIAHDERVADAEHIGIVFSRPLVPDAVLDNEISQVNVTRLGTVPLDPQVALFDAQDRPLMELPDDSPAAHAVWHIADRLFV